MVVVRDHVRRFAAREGNPRIRRSADEARMFVHNQLRSGQHPGLLLQEVHFEMSRTEIGTQRYQLLHCVTQVINNRFSSGQLGGLTSSGDFQRHASVRVGRANVEIMTHARFVQPALDSGMNVEICKTVLISDSQLGSNFRPGSYSSLTRETNQQFTNTREQRWREIANLQRDMSKQQSFSYLLTTKVRLLNVSIGDQDNLRAELADARFRAETAEARLDISTARENDIGSARQQRISDDARGMPDRHYESPGEDRVELADSGRQLMGPAALRRQRDHNPTISLRNGDNRSSYRPQGHPFDMQSMDQSPRSTIGSDRSRSGRDDRASRTLNPSIRVPLPPGTTLRGMMSRRDARDGRTVPRGSMYSSEYEIRSR